MLRSILGAGIALAAAAGSITTTPPNLPKCAAGKALTRNTAGVYSCTNPTAGAVGVGISAAQVDGGTLATAYGGTGTSSLPACADGRAIGYDGGGWGCVAIGGADPTTIQPDDSATDGTSSVGARRDHRHAISAAAPGAVTISDSALEGTATGFARADHRHSVAALTGESPGNTDSATDTNANATATNQAAAAGNTDSATDSSANTTATNQTATVRVQTGLPAVLAAGANYIDSYSDTGSALDDQTGPWTMPLPKRTIQVVGNAASAALNCTIDGTDPDGTALQEVIAHPGGAATTQGTRAFDTITRVRTSVAIGAGGTLTLQTGAGFGVGVIASAIDLVSVDGVVETPTSSHAATGTVIPASAPNGARDYVVRFRQQHNHTQDAHTHTHSGHLHGHTGTHNHTQDAHTHTSPGHSHGHSTTHTHSN